MASPSLSKYLMLLLFFTVFSAFPQAKSTKIRMAEGLLEQNKYYTALQIFEEVAQNDPNNKYLIYQIAQLYEGLNNVAKAADWYSKLQNVEGNEFPKASYKYAEMLKRMGKYEEAVSVFETFVQNYHGHDKYVYNRLVEQQIEGCKKALNAQNNAELQLIPLGHLNGVYNDLAPVCYQDTLLITSIPSDSAITYQDFSDEIPLMNVYKVIPIDTLKDSLQLFLPHILQEAGYHSANVAFSLDQNRLYFNRCKLNNKGKMICAIYGSKKVNGAWQKAVKVKGGVNDDNLNFSALHPTLGFDDRKKVDVLYYASNNPSGGQGGFDLWQCTVDENFEANTPRNFGPRINTPMDEITPFYYYKTQDLFFASNGKVAFGGFDVYRLNDRGRGRFDEEQHLMKPINSEADDFFYHKASPTISYFVSNRKGGNKYVNEQVLDDVYQIKNIGKKYLVVNVLANDSNQSPLRKAKVLVQTGDGLESDGITVDAFKAFQIQPQKQYKILAQKDSFINQSKTFEISYDTEVDTVYWDFVLDSLQLNTAQMNFNFLYASDEYKVKADFEGDLNQLLTFLMDNPDFKVEIAAHTDNVGSAAYNKELSEKRANALKNYFVEKGIGTNRIEAVGYGQTKPIADNNTKKGRESNRRITVSVVDLIGN